MPRGIPAIERFIKHISITESGCWEWTGTCMHGYGYFHADGQFVRAHRWSYKFFAGPIPAGLGLYHLCRNRSCVNPAHLEPATYRENLMRGEGIAARNAAKSACPQGHPYDEANTYRRPDGSRKCRACARARERSRRAGQREYLLPW